MDLDNQIDLDYSDTYWPEALLNASYLEYAIIKLFIIDIPRLIELKSALSKNFHIQPSEIDNMAYWEYEMYIRYIQEQVKEENDRQKAEMDKYKIQDAMKMTNPNNVRKMTDVNARMPQMPSFGTMQAPSMKF